ncbi:LacI family DNA-binding transcriptional regulator [Streptomyces luteolus]|uniref:LacI family DNA-binding transcriptional regulator n=1 Tax=Streptomyces luteolus TaxID=3043615 RepID=A0ABT6SSY8_9ACTN|nr:LacI family DNA-binding transcriptional regulator [Streptomyces sp. B-S-A12]MDI3418731.1 LacI family DNA-binding transcriptional regulator [Streptomyces sp. B-S-A12]
MARATLADVAARAGVSLATASRVLNGSTRVVGAELRDTVMTAAAELRYVPNAQAQALARSTNPTVGLVLHDIADPYFSAIATGVLRVAKEHGLLVTIASTFRDPEQELAYVQALHEQRAQAVILAGSGQHDPAFTRRLEDAVTAYRDSGGRVAAVSQHRLRVDTVRPENEQGAYDMTRLLVQQGHRRFAVVSGPGHLLTVQEREQGVRRALAEADVALTERDLLDGEFTRDGGYRAGQELVGRVGDVTAVFVLSDIMAVGVMSAFRDHGVSVPRDISVAGFDDIPTARDLTPPLTTVRLPLEEMGGTVMRMVLDPKHPRRTRSTHFAATVVVRDSTRTLPDVDGKHPQRS